VVGIAPAVGIQLISVLDLFESGPIMTDDVASKITLATNTLSTGDVLLLELQEDKRPVERNRAVFQAIRLATGVGIVVIEGAGNAGVNLDSEPFMRDSGAIIVGACSPSVPHARWVDAPAGGNFGSRIDCYAWGDGVFTTGARNDPVQSNSYFNFSGTSAAAAIIAGVCLLIQNLQRQAGGAPLNSRAMRDILRNPNNGTASAVPLNDRIGVMPDFLKIIPNQGF
jgi:Subtilase family